MRWKYPAITLMAGLFAQAATAQEIPTVRLTDWKAAARAGTVFVPVQRINFLDAGGNNQQGGNNDSALAALINAVPDSAGLRIYFPPGQYRFRQGIVLKSGITLEGSGDDTTYLYFNLGGRGHCISAAGTQLRFEAAVSAAASTGQRFVRSTQATAWRAGDWCYLKDNDSALITSSWASGSTGQLLKVAGVSGDTLWFDQALRRDYPIERFPRLQGMVPAQNIRLERFAVLREDATTAQTSNIRFERVVNSAVHCVRSVKCNFAHLELSWSARVAVSGSHFSDAFDFGGGGKAYGVVLQFASGECRIERNAFSDLRHSMLFQAGPSGNIVAWNYSQRPKWTGTSLPSDAAGDLVFHGNYPYRNLLEGNVVQNIVIDDSHGKNGPYNTFLRNRAEGYGIFMNNGVPSPSQHFIHNEITSSALFKGNYILAGGDHIESGNNLRGTITPAGTSSGVLSYALDTVPVFYRPTNWPPIGPPAVINSRVTEVQSRQASGLLTLCREAKTNRLTDQPAAGHFWDAYPNPARGTVQLRNRLTNGIRLFVFSADGRENHTLLLPPSGLLSLELPQGLWYFLDAEGNTRMVLVLP
jgi:hypothetical protein